jgi:hypothetical protein
MQPCSVSKKLDSRVNNSIMHSSQQLIGETNPGITIRINGSVQQLSYTVQMSTVLLGEQMPAARKAVFL